MSDLALIVASITETAAADSAYNLTIPGSQDEP